MDELKNAIDFENDKTLRFIYDYLKNSIKITGEKWNKFVKKEENKIQLSTFLTEQASFKWYFSSVKMEILIVQKLSHLIQLQQKPVSSLN
jgi:hypothetical protein